MLTTQTEAAARRASDTPCQETGAPDVAERTAAWARWLAYQLREGGVAADGLPFAFRALPLKAILGTLADPAPWGALCRANAAYSRTPRRRAAWVILAACTPAQVRAHLAERGTCPCPAGTEAVMEARDGDAPEPEGDGRFATAAHPFAEQLQAAARVLFHPDATPRSLLEDERPVNDDAADGEGGCPGCGR